MRFLTSLMLTCVLTAVAVPASAAPRKAHNDCNANDPDRNIAGCTIVAEDPTESVKTRAIAYVGRACVAPEGRQRSRLGRFLGSDPHQPEGRAGLQQSRFGLEGERRQRARDCRFHRCDQDRSAAAVRCRGYRPRQHLRQPRSRLAGRGRSRSRHRGLRSRRQARPQERRRPQPSWRRLAGKGGYGARDSRLHQRDQGECKIHRRLLQPRPRPANQGRSRRRACRFHRRDPSRPGARQRYYARSQAYMEKLDPDAAIADASAAIRLAPDRP